MNEAISLVGEAYELITKISLGWASFILSVIAVLATCLAMSRNKKFNKKSLKISEDLLGHEEVHAELSGRQLEKIEEQEKLERRGDLSVTIDWPVDQFFRLHIKNTGNSVVENIGMIPSERVEQKLVWGKDMYDKLPFPRLPVGDKFHISATPIDFSDRTVPITLNWINEDGSEGSKYCCPSF